MKIVLAVSVSVSATVAIATSSAWAQQNWPAKSIRFVAPFAPGGGTDFIGRVAAQKLTEAKIGRAHV